MLTRLHELATRVAVDVDEHTSRVEEINAELTSTDDYETSAIIKVVARLVQANQQMQSRLASTEDKLREQAQEIEAQAADARTDALTLLANRRAFDAEMGRRLSELQRHGRTFSLIMMDLDLFKRFNDAHGHQAGDEVLRGIGRVLRRRTREMDVVTRYGGEEFAIILPGTTVHEACQTAMRTCKAIENSRFSFEGKELRVTASLGVAQVSANEDQAALVKRADAALYASKEAGRNCVHWHDGRRSQRVCPASEAGPQAACGEAHQGKETSAPEQVLPADAAPAASGREPAPPAEPPEPLPLSLPAEATDRLCGVVSRSAFCQHVRNSVAQWRCGGPALAVLLVAMDQYDELSNQRAAESAEAAVRAVTVSIVGAIRDVDLAARYSPGCVALLLPGAELADAIHVAEQLHEAVAQCVMRECEGEPRITVSVAVAEVTQSDGQVELLRRAESALAAATARGGDATYYHDGDRCAPITALLQAMGYLT